MYQATTKPYVKQLDANGVVINPVSNHVWNGSNRQNRRAKEPRAFNNSKNCQMLVTKTYRWIKSVQFISQKDGSIKRINHLVFAN